jgi:ribonuclease R
LNVSKKKPAKSKGKFVTRRAAHAPVRAPRALTPAQVEGRIDAHPDGHGFLHPDDASPRVFLPAAEMRQVLHGDRARVRITGEDHRGRPSGEVIEVLERAHLRIVGRVHAEHGVLFLVPSDRRIAQDIVVPPGAAGRAKPGDIATVDLVSQPTRNAQPVGRVAEVLGHYTDSGIEIEIALRKFDLPHEFGKGALAETRKLPDAVRDEDLKGRRDLRKLPFVTIDGETAKDFDDAVCARREGEGFRLWVAIADVSHYVRHGSALDLDARDRGTSVYFPRRVIPMLPEKLSNGLCSLNPDVDRLAVACEMRIEPDGSVQAYEFYPAVIHSRARLTYTSVWEKLSTGHADTRLAALYDCYRVLARERARRGAIDFETLETRMEFDARGRIRRIVPEQRNDAHRLIEECMLAANVCAGAFLAELGLQIGGGERPKPKDYARLLERIRSRPDFGLLQTILLRSLKQAVYSPENVGHFGLAFDAYVHFTSPIRRYPDLVVHRAIRAALAGRRYDGVDWNALGVHCSETERRADEASRDVENWLKCQYMQEHVGAAFEGRITGVTAFGVFVTLDDYYVDGLIHVSELGRDYFRFDAARHLLLGERTGRRYRLADPVRVRLVRVDLERRKIDFVPA